ncbi:MAG: outer membrane beta-barrel protein [Bacteroidota bacterium]
MRGICLLWIIGISSISIPLQAQLSISVSAGVGGTVLQPVQGAAEQAMVSYSVVKDAGQIFESAFGTGINTRLRLAYTFSRHLSVDLDASFFSGLSRIYARNQVYDQYSENIVKSPRLGLNPAVALSTGWRIFAPYVRVGILIPGFQKIRATKIQQVEDNEWRRDIRLVGQTSFGWNGGLGMSYKLNKRVKMFYEFEFISQHTSIRKASLVSFFYNDEDIMPELETYQKEVRYRKHLDEHSNRPLRSGFDPDKSLDAKVYKRSTSSITANLGIILNLN